MGNAAIQLARWADATVVTTVSSPDKAQLAAAAGADHVVNYRSRTSPPRCARWPRRRRRDRRGLAAANAGSTRRCIGPHGSVAMYADDGGAEVTIPVRAQMVPNARWQFVLVYTEPARAKVLAVEDVERRRPGRRPAGGPEAGLPLHVFPLAQTADAHRAVQDGAVGKVLVDVTA